MKLIVALAVSGMLLLGQSDSPASHAVTAVRYWSLSDVTRVAIEVTGGFEFRTDRLHNPERVYFDILNSRPRFDGKRLYSEAVNDKLLLKIRVAETNPGITRVVLDLSGNVESTTSTLTNPNRLIIELRTPSGTPRITDPAPATASDRPAAQKPGLVPSVTVKPATAIVKPPPKIETPHLPEPPPTTESPRTLETPHADGSAPGLTPDKGSADNAAPPRSASASGSVAHPASPTGAAPVIPVEHAPAPDVGSAMPVAHASAAPVPAETAKGAHHTSDGTNSLIRALGLKINRVVIDPGHGGHDQGTEGTKGLLEKDLVLDVALRVGKLVQERMSAEVIYTRSDDTFVPLEGRTALANEKKADLFLSIHANSSPYPRISGVETYYLNITGTKDAMDLAARENGANNGSVFELQDIIKKITLHDKSEESHEFAKRVQASLYNFNIKNFPGTKDRGVKTAPFVVLIGANMPSVLAEIGFVTNSKEEVLLKKPDYRQKLAEALYKGMEKYAEGLSHFQATVRP